ncbi:MAG: glutamyl-tRNA reductase, partial [Rhodospirillales bacterium]|nr:glutamyl-tRNA reductase [Rhodospirillales bacterium]
RLMAEDVDQAAMLGDLAATGIGQAVLLATCDRLEVVGLHPDPEGASAALEKLFAQRAQTPPEEIAAQGYRRFGEAALRHVFAVAASLDSQVTGEPQVLGQVKDSHRAAAAAGTMSAELETVLQAAYAAAKRVRSETAIAERPVSIASAALMIARNLHGDLTHRRVLLVGLGEMAELMAQELKDAGMTDFMVVHTSAGRAEATAHRLQGHFRPWSELAEALVNADIAVTSLGSGRQCVTTAMADGVLRQRKRRPILFIDTAIPGDVEPGVGALDGAFVYDLGDLESVAREGKASRDATAAAAWKVLDEELAAFLQKRAERGATPAVAALRRHFELVRNQVLAQGNLDAEAATRLLVKRLLHDPSEALRAAAARAGSGEDLERTIARLFRLEDRAASAEEAPEEEDGP